MRIISKFKDYYDGVQSLGMDKTLVYERFEKNQLLPKLKGHAEYQREKRTIKKLTNIKLDGAYYFSKKYIEVNYLEIGFCGRLIPSIQFVHFKDSKKIAHEFYYDSAAVLNYIEQLKLHNKKNHFNGWYKRSIEKLSTKSLNAYFQHSIFQKSYISWFQEFGTPVFIFNQNYYPPRSRINFSKDERNDAVSIVQNPSLKLMKFYRFKDAYSAYQDIAQFLGGVLTNTEQGDSNLDDLSKIKQHGFDIKYGFRKRPKSR